MLVIIVSMMLLVSGIIGCIVDHYLCISEQSFSFWLIKVGLNAMGILALMVSMILILSVRLNAEVKYSMMLFILGFFCCWFVMSAVIVISDIDVLPISFYWFITFPMWIIIYPVYLVIMVTAAFMRWIKEKLGRRNS